MTNDGVTSNDDGASQARGETHDMCQRVTCPRCGKPTWAGCGAHVEQALAGVPKDQRCQCPPPKSLLSRLLGK